MKLPKISVLTPTYNRIHLIQEMIWMFKNQDYPNKELIIVNDNPNIFFTCNEEDVFVYNFPKMQSLGEIRNMLIDLSRGELVHFWDDDDVRDKDALSKLYQFYAERKPSTLAVAFENYVYFENYVPAKETANGGNHIFFGLFSKNYTNLFRFDPNLHLGEDQDFVRKGFYFIDTKKTKETPIAYCWGNDAWHVSGELIDLSNSQEHLDRKKLFEDVHATDRHRRIQLVPTNSHDFFMEFNKFFNRK